MSNRPASPRFTPATLSFLRALERHNDREWFRAHKERYEAHVRAPMVGLIERLAEELPRFAPDLVASAKVSMYRPYRDTRFSADKRPLKTFVSAIFPCKGLPKHAGAGLYVEVNPRHTLVAGGMYAPDRADLHRVRQHLAANHRRFRTLAEAPSFVRSFGGLQGESLRRVPPGFPADHPAAEYLKRRQFLMAREFAASFATTPRFFSTLLTLFRRMAPLVCFLNEPLLAAAGAIVDPLGPLAPPGRPRRL
jgi:uncharacterized protein (TIGR02453 family)